MPLQPPDGFGGVGAGELSAGFGALCEAPVVDVAAPCAGGCDVTGGLGGGGGATGFGASAGALMLGAGRGGAAAGVGFGVLGAAVVFRGAALRALFRRAGFAFRAAAFLPFAAGRPRRFAVAPFFARLAVRAAALRRFAVFFFAGRFAFLRPAPLDLVPVRAIKPPVLIHRFAASMQRRCSSMQEVRRFVKALAQVRRR